MIDIEKLPKKGLYIGFVALVLVAAYFMIMKAISKARAAKDAKELRNDLDKQNLSFDISQYSILADKLEYNIGPWTTSESAVYNVFKSLQNSDDVKQLVQSFGSRTWTILTGKMTLVQYIGAGMDDGEIEEINSILTGKGINIQF